LVFLYERKSILDRSFRAALSDVLIKIAEENPKLVVLNADCARALSLKKFGEKYPDRIICVGISEADMLTTAAGLSTTGIIPVVVGFSMFVTEKPFEQIRQSIAYPNLNVKIIATHAGLCVGQDGATHQILEDLAIMRTLPNFKIFVAADVSETESCIKEMLFHDGPAYLRLGRDLAEDIFPENKIVVSGGSDLIKSGTDVTIAACGLMVEQALQAAVILEEEGINASVMNLYSIKPLDREALVSQAETTGAFVCAEDHSVVGGMGSAVSEIFAQYHPVPMEFIGIKDVFGESGIQSELYEKYGLTAECIVNAARTVISRKKACGGETA
jgi:transketolase